MSYFIHLWLVENSHLVIEPQGNCWLDKPFDMRITKLFISSFTTVCLYSRMTRWGVKRPKPEKGNNWKKICKPSGKSQIPFWGRAKICTKQKRNQYKKCPQKLRKNIFHLCQKTSKLNQMFKFTSIQVIDWKHLVKKNEEISWTKKTLSQEFSEKKKEEIS